MSISRQQATASTVMPALRRRVVSTELGPVTVRVQQGTGSGSDHGNGHPATPAADVYLHGAAGCWTTFRPLLSAVPDVDRVLIDLPGWGESTAGARLEHFSVETMGRAVVEILDSLGYRRWNLVGHSMGGFLALHLAARWPGRVPALRRYRPPRSPCPRRPGVRCAACPDSRRLSVCCWPCAPWRPSDHQGRRLSGQSAPRR